MNFDYFYGQQADLFSFYRIPKILFSERFWNISTDAKLLYGILLDRMNLSAKNGWLDEAGRVYIIFTIDEIKSSIGCAEKKSVKLLDELEKKAGLIERKRQGLGKPNLLYVKNFVSGSVDNTVERQVLNCQNDNSGMVKITTPDLSKAQGNNTNINNTEFSYQYVTEGTFDAYLYQTLENKQKFISQIMTSKSPVRSCDDVDEQALSYAEIKALCAGNPMIREKMDLDVEVARLKVLKSDHQSQQYRLEDRLLKYFPAEIERQQGFISGFTADVQTAIEHPQNVDGFCGMEVKGFSFTEKADAGEALINACKEYKGTDLVPVGSYRGFQMELSFDSFRREFDVVLKADMSHRVSLGTDPRGNLLRIDNALSSVPEKLEKVKEQLTNLYNQQEAAKGELGKPFPQESELSAKSARLAELDAALSMDDNAPDKEEPQEGRSSVLADLKQKSEHIPPMKHGTDRYEEVI